MKRLLVVDDDADTRFLVREILERLGYEVAEATGGWEALESLKNEQIHAMILDITLKDIEGMAVLRRVRADPDRKTLPVIMLSAHRSKATIEEAEELGASAYLTKPVDGDELAHILQHSFYGRH